MFQMFVIFETQLNLLPMFKSEQILHQLVYSSGFSLSTLQPYS